MATAGSSELALAAWAAGRREVPAHKMHFFVHWLGRKGGKAGLLSSIARRQPTVRDPGADGDGGRILRRLRLPHDAGALPRRSVAGAVDGADSIAADDPPAAAFRRLVVAGAARMDKGFGQVVELVHEMKRRDLGLPIVVQASNSGRDAAPPDVAAAIERLQAAGYAGLSMRSETLDPAAYRELFEGAVVLQPYRAEDFRDRVSGVTLDALGAGCPVVVTAQTWMAAVAERFGAGVATADLSAAGLLAAVETVLADYDRYAAGARAAARELRAQHSARRLIDVVLQREPAGP